MILRSISKTTLPRKLFSTSPSKNNNNTLWQKLKTPCIFGAGVYLGLVMLSGEKEEPALFTEMKWKMIGGDKK
jgi:hypothetical protein